MAAIAKLSKFQPAKGTHTTLDTILLTQTIVKSWKIPPFQRPIRENEKVLELAETLKRDSGVVPGVVTLGVLDGHTYVCDGQHRLHAFKISGLSEGYCDVRRHYFETLADMGKEFVRLNSQLVRLRPDDILRGLETSSEALQEIRRRCPFVGYEQIRRGAVSPLISMSAVLRQWHASRTESPMGNCGGLNTIDLVSVLIESDTKELCEFLTLALGAFGRDREYVRMWGALNMTLCMWLYRRLVVSQYSSKSPRLTKELFKQCLMSVTANADYLDWLPGRNLSERDRAPAYARIKASFARRILAETGKAPLLPKPAWAHTS